MATYKDIDQILKSLPDDLPYKASVKRVLMQAPEADVVEVVRCKDCIHATMYRCRNEARHTGVICEYGVVTCYEDFYCSYGERKE